jgi:glycosyltransferase involved in cell wall biosynthesis
MRVGLNLYHLVPGETGGAETYDRCLIEALVRIGPELELVLFAFAPAAAALAREPWSGEVRFATRRGTGRNRFGRVAAEQALLPIVRRHRIDLLHNLLTTAPAFPGVPQVTTVHDLIYRRFPETHFALLNLGVAALVPVAVRRSTRLLTPSEATKADLVRELGADPDRVDVTGEGPGLPQPASLLRAEEVRERFDLGSRPVVLSVSAKRPHKNLERLLTAFAHVRHEPQPVLVLPGYATPHEQELHRSAPANVRFLGWVEDAELDSLYRIATCLVFPSLAEGFGLPVLEAMTRGTPVACSDTSSLPEVAGQAALYFDPRDGASITRAIERLLADDGLRERLRAAGVERARRFTWQGAAEATIASYTRALEQS